MLNNWDEWPENYSMKKTISKGFILYNSIYITFLKWQNYRTGENTWGLQELRTRDGEQGIEKCKYDYEE